MFMQIKYNNHDIICSENISDIHPANSLQLLFPYFTLSLFIPPKFTKNQAIRSGGNPPQTARFNRNMKKISL